MPDSKVSVQRAPRDYTGDQQAAKELAKKVQEYYHTRGNKAVRCWVEPELLPSGRKLWGVRSNIIFDASTLVQQQR